MTDWNDPEDRGRLIENIGVEAYNTIYEALRRSLVVTTVNGHSIVPVYSRFGQLFQVNNTNRAFATLAEAETYASELPKGLDQ